MGMNVSYESNFDEAISAIKSGMQKGVENATEESNSILKDKLSGQGSGRTYQIPGTNQTYTASSPGEPPAERTGELKESYEYMINPLGDTITGYLGTNNEVAKMLEFGTSKMAARPHLNPTFKNNLEIYKEIMSNAISGEVG